MIIALYPLPDRWLLTFGNVAAASLLIGLIALCMCRFARRRPAPVQHGLLLMGLLLMLAAPLVVGASNVAGLGFVQVALERPTGHKIGSATPVSAVSVPDASSVRDTFSAALFEDVSLWKQGAPDALLVIDDAGTEPTTTDPAPINASRAARSADVAATDLPPGPSSPLAVSTNPEEPPVDSAVTARVPRASNDSRSLQDAWRSAASMACLAWMFGALTALVRLWLDLRAVRRLCRESTPADEDLVSACRAAAARLNLRRVPAVCLSSSVPVPMTAGCRRPTILLPAEMPGCIDSDPLQAVLLHELAHIARRDLWIGLLQRLCAAAYWWNPLLHRLNRRLSDVRENICDNHVLAHVRDGRRYARVLLDLADRVTAAPALPTTVGLVAEPSTGLSARITGLLKEERNMDTRLSRCSTVCLTLFALVIGIAIGAFALRSELRTPLVDGPGLVETNAAPLGVSLVSMEPPAATDSIPIPTWGTPTLATAVAGPAVGTAPALEFSSGPEGPTPIAPADSNSPGISVATDFAPPPAVVAASEPPPLPTSSRPDSFDLPPRPTIAPPTELNPIGAAPDARPADLDPFASSRDSLPAGGPLNPESLGNLPVPVPAPATADSGAPRPNDVILLTLRANDDGSLEDLFYFTTPLGNDDEAFKKLEQLFAEKSAERADPLLPNLELQLTVDRQLRYEHVMRVLDVGGRRIARITFPQTAKSGDDTDLVLSVGFVRHRSGQPLSETPVVFWRDQVHGVGSLQGLLGEEYRRIDTSRPKERVPVQESTVSILLQVDEAVGYDAVNSIIKQAQNAGFRKFVLKVLSPTGDAPPAAETPERLSF